MNEWEVTLQIIGECKIKVNETSAREAIEHAKLIADVDCIGKWKFGEELSVKKL